MAGALEGRRPATSEDIKAVQAELRAIGRRLDKIEERLPKKRGEEGGKGEVRGGSSKS